MWEHGRLILFLFGLLSLAACNSWRDASLANQGNVQLSVVITSPQRNQTTNSRVVEARIALAGASRVDSVEVAYQAQGGASGTISLTQQQGSWKGELPGTLVPGQYTLKATAVSGAYSKESDPLTFVYDPTVNVQSVQVSWVAPSANAEVSGQVRLRIDAQDQPRRVSKVFFLADKGGVTSFLGDATSSDGRFWDFTWDTAGFANGPLVIQAVAVGDSGSQGVASRSFTVNNPDLVKPTVTWLDPLDNQNVAGSTTLRLRVLDNQAVQEVRVFAGGTLLSVLSQAPYELVWDSTTVADGPVVLKAVATDTAGNSSNPAEITVNVRNQGVPPLLSILLPQADVAVGVQFTARASVTRQQTSFTWQPTSGNNLWARVYDYRGRLVQEKPLRVNGAQPSDNADSVAEAVFDLGNVPNDTYRLVVEGFVVVNGAPFRLYQERMVEVKTNSNLPPALVIYQPRDGTILPSGFLYLVGDVTDDSGRVHAVEVRLIGGTCQNPSQENYLLRYEAGPYGLFFMTIPLDAYPFIANGGYCLRVVGVDAADRTLRNIQEFNVTVDRGAGPVPTATISASPSTIVVPGTASWTVSFSSAVRYTALLRKDGKVVEGRSGSGASLSFSRAFSDQDVGAWDLVVVFEDGTGIQGFASGGPVAVTRP